MVKTGRGWTRGRCQAWSKLGPRSLPVHSWLRRIANLNLKAKQAAKLYRPVEIYKQSDKQLITSSHFMSSTSEDKPASRRNLADTLARALLGILLFVPLAISYLLYSWEKAAPPSVAFWIPTSYFLVGSGTTFAGGCAIARSGSYRLIEPSVMYLIAFINFYRVPVKEDQPFYDPHSSGALLWLVIISLGLLALYNGAMYNAGRPNLVVNAEYMGKIRNTIFVGFWNAICPSGRGRATGEV
ncbi:hypothetical protein DFH06DRAFT_730433 [Mycena polygramma]|nr:hypothetical protein DFH06DRAFT_730433 [Mycena polygramma]